MQEKKNFFRQKQNFPNADAIADANANTDAEMSMIEFLKCPLITNARCWIYKLVLWGWFLNCISIVVLSKYIAPVYYSSINYFQNDYKTHAFLSDEKV